MGGLASSMRSASTSIYVSLAVMSGAVHIDETGCCLDSSPGAAAADPCLAKRILSRTVRLDRDATGVWIVANTPCGRTGNRDEPETM